MAERDYLSDIEALKHELYAFQALELIYRYQQSRKPEMNTLKRIWQFLSTDIEEIFPNLACPELVPIKVGVFTWEYRSN